MSPTTSLAVWSIASLAGMAGLLALLMWALFRDPGRGARRCPRCWHDLSATSGLRCTECGREWPSEKWLHRRRRRWGVALVAFAALVAITLHLRVQWGRTGWAALLPDAAVVALLPLSTPGGPLGDALEEVGDRVGRGQLSSSNVAAVLRRIAEGDSGAPPGSQAWRRKYGGLLSRWRISGRLAVLGDPPDPQALRLVEQMEAPLLALPPALAFELPSVWPAGTALVPWITVERFWPVAADLRLRVASTTLPAAPADEARRVRGWVRVDGGWTGGVRIPWYLGQLPADMPAGVINGSANLEWEWRMPGERDWRPGGTVACPIAVTVAAPSPPLAPRHGPEMDAVIRDAFRDGMLRWPRGERRFAIRFRPMLTDQALFQDVALGLEVEIREDGEVRRRTRLWWAGDGSRTGWEMSQEDQEALARAEDGNSRWTMRVRGVHELALRASLQGGGARASAYWDGEVVIPLRVQEMEGPALVRPWTLDPPEPPLHSAP